MYLFRNKVQYVNSKAVKPAFYEKMEVTRVPPGRPLRTTLYFCFCKAEVPTTGWELLFYNNISIIKRTNACYIRENPKFRAC